MTETLKKLLILLSDGHFHSGEQLGKTLGLTRSAVWKLTNQLLVWDLEIESTTNKGYRIPGGVSLLDKEKILCYVAKEQQNELEQLDILESVASTNDYLLNRGSTGYQKPKKALVCLAEKQTQGKGRRGRTWISPFAKNIYLSLLWHFPQDPGELTGLSLAIAIAVIETLKIYGITRNLGIKWPNDILCENQKLAGILIELSGEANDSCNAVIGIGLNVQMPYTKTQDITQPWTDVQTLMNKTINRNELAGLLLNEAIKSLRSFKNHGLKAFVNQWQTFDLTFGKSISITSSTASYQGIGQGINPQGHFLLEIKPGLVKSFASGEVSLRFT